MKIEVQSDTSVEMIAEWLSDNVSPGYAFVPTHSSMMFEGLQYKAFDGQWLVNHYFDYQDKMLQYVSVEGLMPEQESMLCLLFS